MRVSKLSSRGLIRFNHLLVSGLGLGFQMLSKAASRILAYRTNFTRNRKQHMTHDL